jgi:hypothetical protein
MTEQRIPAYKAKHLKEAAEIILLATKANVE